MHTCLFSVQVQPVTSLRDVSNLTPISCSFFRLPVSSAYSCPVQTLTCFLRPFNILENCFQVWNITFLWTYNSCCRSGISTMHCTETCGIMVFPLWLKTDWLYIYRQNNLCNRWVQASHLLSQVPCSKVADRKWPKLWAR